MKVAISGASGLIGSALSRYLRERGHTVVPLVRRRPSPGLAGPSGGVYWSPDKGEIDSASLEGIDAVVNLAGESIAEGRWTSQKKQRILESRVNGTRLLAETLASLGRKPRVFISGSAIGYYGSRGGELLNESSSRGDGFLADVCSAWEAAAAKAESAGIRTVRCRIGVVLDTAGGALHKILPLFKFGLGGPVGDGKQYWSWISLIDLIRSIEFLLNSEISGPVNSVAPHPVTNNEFTRVLGHVLHRPAILPAPAPALRVGLGEMADEMLLASQNVEPLVLLSRGFKFQHGDLESALVDILKGATPSARESGKAKV